MRLKPCRPAAAPLGGRDRCRRARDAAPAPGCSPRTAGARPCTRRGERPSRRRRRARRRRRPRSARAPCARGCRAPARWRSRPCASSSFAMPKSVSFTTTRSPRLPRRPAARRGLEGRLARPTRRRSGGVASAWPSRRCSSRTFSGFTSRWTTPAACACARAPSSSTPSAAAISGGKAPDSPGAACAASVRERTRRRGTARPRRPRHVEDLDDVSVAQLGDRLGLRLEAMRDLAALAEVGVKHLDRDVPPETSVVRAVNRGHPAVPELLEHVVLRKRRYSCRPARRRWRPSPDLRVRTRASPQLGDRDSPLWHSKEISARPASPAPSAFEAEPLHPGTEGALAHAERARGPRLVVVGAGEHLRRGSPARDRRRSCRPPGRSSERRHAAIASTSSRGRDIGGRSYSSLEARLRARRS